jgi:hypothetical protein
MFISLVILTCMYHDARYRDCKTRFVILCDVGIYEDFNSLKPSGYLMYARFSIQNYTFCPQSTFMCFCIDLRINSDYVQH